MNSPARVNEYAQKLAEQARTPENYKGEIKIYFHHHNYAKFHFDLGGSRVKTISFANHRYVTDDVREQDQLDLVANNPGTFIYTLANSETEAILEQERLKELQAEVFKTAQAQAAANGLQFDPNAQTIPVQVQQVTSTPMTIMPVTNTQQVRSTGAVVGMQNSLSGTAAVEGGNMQMTTPDNQTSAPGTGSAADQAAARIAEMSKNTK